MNKLILAIDIGTTHCKAITFNEKAEPIHAFQTNLPMISLSPEQKEQDADFVFNTVLSLIQQSINENKPETIKGICFSAAMHSILAVDKNGKPLTRALTWADTQSKISAENLLKSKASHFIYQQTGTPIHPMSPFCKIRWIKEERPEIFEKTYKFISIKEYIFYKLFGKYIIDHSIASATGLFDIYKLCWLPEALAAAGIEQDALSTPVPVIHIETEFLPEYQQFLQFSDPIPFIVGGNDGCLANLGCGAINDGEAALSIGTSGAIRMINKKIKTDTQQRLFNYLLTDKLYITGGPINNGGIVLQWFDQLFEKENETKTIHDLLELASTVNPGSENLLFLPYLLGERAPMWDANARGVFFGLQYLHKKAHLTRAVLEGICFAMYDIFNALEETNGSIEHIYASGGFIQSPFWLQLLSDLFGKKILLNNTEDASATGAAFMGMYALKWISDLEDVNKMLPELTIYSPDDAIHQQYQPLYKIFHSLYPKLKHEFYELSHLEYEKTER